MPPADRQQPEQEGLAWAIVDRLDKGGWIGMDPHGQEVYDAIAPICEAAEAQAAGLRERVKVLEEALREIESPKPSQPLSDTGMWIYVREIARRVLFKGTPAVLTRAALTEKEERRG